MEKVQTNTIIEEELISQSTFDQLIKVEQAEDLERKITDALLIGNSYHTNVSIVYRDDEGIKKTTTTIWARGSKFIYLKGGLLIPFDKIIDVELV
jgi:hypothetical protein